MLANIRIPWQKWALTHAIAWLVAYGLFGISGTNLIVGLLLGLFSGIAQVQVISSVAPNRWVTANVLGWTLSYIPAFIISNPLRYTIIAPIGVQGAILWGVIGGAFVGILQWIAAFRSIRSSVAFLPYLIIASALAGAGAQYFLNTGLQAIGLTSDHNILSVGIFILSGAIYGAITAIPVFQMLRFPQSKTISTPTTN